MKNSQLLVRDVDPELVNALKQRAAANNCSAEAEHREILEQALRVTRRVPLSEALMKIPPSDKDGDDKDFERQEGVPFVNPFSS